jgi:hypothetical protein
MENNGRNHIRQLFKVTEDFIEKKKNTFRNKRMRRGNKLTQEPSGVPVNILEKCCTLPSSGEGNISRSNC